MSEMPAVYEEKSEGTFTPRISRNFPQPNHVVHPLQIRMEPKRLVEPPFGNTQFHVSFAGENPEPLFPAITFSFPGESSLSLNEQAVEPRAGTTNQHQQSWKWKKASSKGPCPLRMYIYTNRWCQPPSTHCAQIIQLPQFALEVNMGTNGSPLRVKGLFRHHRGWIRCHLITNNGLSGGYKKLL